MTSTSAVKSLLPYLAMTVALAAVTAIFAPETAKANRAGCAAQCRAAHNQCRMAARSVSAPRCDAQLQSCLERCSRAR